MSFQPPRSEKSDRLPGYIIVLVAFSILVALLTAGAGLVAFGVVSIGGNDSEPTPLVGVAGQALQASGFTVRETREIDGKTEIVVNVAVTNVSDERQKNSTMMVQCLDGGNASTSQLILGIDPDQTLQFELTLYGLGQPACADPTIEFDTD